LDSCRYEPPTETPFRHKRHRPTKDRQDLVRHAVRRARDGDEQALRYLYIRFADHVYSYVASIVNDQHEAEDITQMIFARLPRALRTYQEREVPFTAWILRVARHTAIDQQRARHAVPSDDVLDLVGSTQDGGGHGRMESIKEALGQLPADQREVLVLRHVMGLTPHEIAERLQKTDSAVHGLHHRGRRAARLALAGMGQGPMVSGGHCADPADALPVAA